MAVGDLLVCILDRPRHEGLIAEVRKRRARVMLIPDGDVSAVIAAAAAELDVAPDIYMGLGAAAAALKCMGGRADAGPPAPARRKGRTVRRRGGAASPSVTWPGAG